MAYCSGLVFEFDAIQEESEQEGLVKLKLTRPKDRRHLLVWQLPCNSIDVHMDYYAVCRDIVCSQYKMNTFWDD